VHTKFTTWYLGLLGNTRENHRNTARTDRQVVKVCSPYARLFF
jgi:hypothetical protein